MNDSITNETGKTCFSAGRLVFGLALVAVGILAFLDAIDLWNPHELWRWWPLLLIAIGLSKEFDALRTRRADGGYVLVAIGAWMLVGSRGYLGLDYRTAFPIGVAVAGLGMMLHALLGVETRKEKRS